MFELNQKRRGHGSDTILKSDDLADIARISAEKSGKDVEDIFDLDLGGDD